jgi:hypothetical protein
MSGAGYEFNFLCTLHNLRFAYDRPADVEPALLRCPVCAHEREAVKDKAMRQVQEHRDALMKAIDLTRLVQAA